MLRGKGAPQHDITKGVNMKRIFFIFLALALSACAPAATPAVNTPIPTNTSIPTLAPTATPVAVDGVADVDGLYYVFDEKTQSWEALPNLEAEHQRVILKEDGSIVALDEKDVEIFVLTDGEWVKTEKVYTSCVDPELQKEVDAEFLEITGISVAELVKRLMKRG